MKYLSLFSGIGGFELGIQQAHESLCNVDGSEDGGGEENQTYDERQRFLAKKRQEASTAQRSACECSSDGIDERPLCIGYSEIDKYATAIYQKHFPRKWCDNCLRKGRESEQLEGLSEHLPNTTGNGQDEQYTPCNCEHKNYGDITKIAAESLPNFDLLVGGFPCQAFSIAGKRMGFSDTRGTLFFEIARILKQKQPRLLLLENVKGLLSHQGGDTFKTILRTLDELGYDLQWQVLNSKNFGVPQNRERVFIVGHLRGTSRPEVFPIGTSNEEYAKGLTQLNNPKFSSNRIYSKDGISPNIRTMQGGNLQPKVWLEPKIRRLTPTECERLQGFPDNWTEGISDTQRYKCLGNAVTTNVIQAIMEKLL